MSEIKISVTEAARNFADCVNRVRYLDTTFVLLKNGLPVARIAPVEELKNKKVCTGRDLAEALSRVQLSEEEAIAWRNDLEAGRAILQPPVDPWL